MIKKRVNMGCQIPKGYGFAWYNDYGFVLICYPIPLNIIMRLLMIFYHWLQSGIFMSQYEKTLTDAFQEGKKYGREEYLKRIIDNAIKQMR